MDTAKLEDVMGTVEDALEIIGNGGMVIVVDDESRENEGDLVMAAEMARASRSAEG